MSAADLIHGADDGSLSSANSVTDQYQTGWWNTLTGGRKEKASAIAMADVDRDFQSKEAQKNRDYQTEMSNSAYQRAKTDMIAAGLNPALMYSKGSGASTPSGATASGSKSTPPASSTGQLMSLIAATTGAVAYGVRTGASMLKDKVASKVSTAAQVRRINKAIKQNKRF